MSVVTDCQLDLHEAILALPAFAAETFVLDWVPTIERKDLQARQIHINPESRSTKLIGRGVKQTVLTFILAIVSPHKQNIEGDIAEADQVLIDKLIDDPTDPTILGVRVGTRRKAMVESIDQLFIADETFWRKYRQASVMVRVKMIV